jgi:hypothetical protein
MEPLMLKSLVTKLKLSWLSDFLRNQDSENEPNKFPNRSVLAGMIRKFLLS